MRQTTVLAVIGNSTMSSVAVMLASAGSTSEQARVKTLIDQFVTSGMMAGGGSAGYVTLVADTVPAPGTILTALDGFYQQSI